MRKKLLALFGLILFVSLFVSTFVPRVYAEASAAAACADTEVSTDLGCLPNDPAGFVSKFYGWGVGLIGSVAVLFVIIGGFYLMTSQGNPETIQKGKSFIYYAIAGLLLAIMGFVFIEIVNGQILNIPGFS